MVSEHFTLSITQINIGAFTKYVSGISDGAPLFPGTPSGRLPRLLVNSTPGWKESWRMPWAHNRSLVLSTVLLFKCFNISPYCLVIWHGELFNWLALMVSHVLQCRWVNFCIFHIHQVIALCHIRSLLCIYIYIYIYIYICMYVCVCVYIYKYISFYFWRKIPVKLQFMNGLLLINFKVPRAIHSLRMSSILCECKMSKSYQKHPKMPQRVLLIQIQTS